MSLIFFCSEDDSYSTDAEAAEAVADAALSGSGDNRGSFSETETSHSDDHDDHDDDEVDDAGASDANQVAVAGDVTQKFAWSQVVNRVGGIGGGWGMIGALVRETHQ